MEIKQIIFTASILTLLSSADIDLHAQAVWPSFLGQGAGFVQDTGLNQGQSGSSIADSLPLTWSPSKNVRWRASLRGNGQSSPIVWGNTAYVTSIEGKMKETCIVTAIDVRDGSEQWTRCFKSSMPLRSNYFQSRAAPTPVVDADHLVTFFETGNLVGLNPTSGETLWERSLTEDYGAFESTIGLATSPAQYGDSVFLMIDHEGDSYLLAIDKATGKTIWRTDRFSRKSYASPTVIPIGGNHQVICSSDGSVDGYDPESGEQLWTFEDVGANTSNTPLLAADNTILIGASPGMHDANLADARRSNLCLRIDSVENGFQPRVRWKSEKATTTFASPMAHQGYAYWVTNAGILFCYDLSSGKTMYRKRAGEPCWVTPIGIGERIYLFGKGGKTTVIAAGPEFRVLAENELWDLDSIPATSPSQFSGAGTPRPNAEGQHPKANAKVEASKKPGDDSAAQHAGDAERRRPPMNSNQIAAARARGENRFADPIQYGVALTHDAILIRTGNQVHCISTEAPQ